MNKLKRTKKCYTVNTDKLFDDGMGFVEEHYVYAQNRNQAKKELLDFYQYYDLDTGENITYLNIPVIRCKTGDKYEFEGGEHTMGYINHILNERKRKEELDELLKKEVTHYYIKKGMYYRPEAAGYTDFKYLAGVYSTKEAVTHAKGCSDITLIPINIDEHNQMILDTIEQLKQQLINHSWVG
jgi:phosphopantetheinyl transferase (holo-ACP synthase)